MIECPAGQFGLDCIKRCSEHCLVKDLCDRVRGECTGGCLDGFVGTHCNKCKSYFLVFCNVHKEWKEKRWLEWFPCVLLFCRNHAKLIRNVSHANIMQICSHGIRMDIVKFSCELFFACFLCDKKFASIFFKKSMQTHENCFSYEHWIMTYQPIPLLKHSSI